MSEMLFSHNANLVSFLSQQGGYVRNVIIRKTQISQLFKVRERGYVRNMIHPQVMQISQLC